MSTSGTVWSIAKLSMLGAAACGLLYRFPISCFWCRDPPEDLLQADRLAKLQMLNKLQENPGIKFVGALRLPDSSDRKNNDIDLVILTRRQLYVVEIKDWSGKVKCETDGSWCQKCRDSGPWLRHENIVEDGQKRAALLDLYLLRRGLKLPTSRVQLMIVFTNPFCHLDQTALSIPGVLSSQKWEAFLRKKAQKSSLNWIISNKKRTMSDGLYQQLLDILHTAPTWDSLTLDDGRTFLGDFLRFNASADDMERLKNVKRSRTSDLHIIGKEEHIEILGIRFKTASWAEVRHIVRDYRKNTSKTERKDNMVDESSFLAQVRGNTEVVFQVVGTIIPQVFKIEAVLSIHLSA